MKNLSEIQAFVARSVQRRDPLPPDPAAAREAELALVGNARLSAVEMLDVYREQFFLRHVGALREDFPALEHMLGDAGFDDAACTYLAAIPPRDFSLRDLGARLPGFLREAAPWSADPRHADLARFEWAYVDAWDAPDAPPLDPAKIAAMPEDGWARARVVFHPSLTLLDLCIPAHRYRAAVRAGEPVEPPSLERTMCAVYMGHETLECAELEPGAYALVTRLARGVPLGVACEEAVAETRAEPAAFEAEIGGWFQGWTQRGWVVDLT